MAYLPAETSETIWNLLKQLLKIVEDPSAAEFSLFERYGETDSTLSNLEDLKNLTDEAASRYSQLFNIRLRIAEAQPNVPSDMLSLLERAINQSQLRIPALERSLEEIKIEWNLS